MTGKVNFKEALSLLIEGHVLALPTETVYGLAGRIDNKKTIEKIFSLKKRPFFDPLIVHCFDKKQALSYLSQEKDFVEGLFDFFSPGPLTVVAQKNKKISPLITAGQATVALRIPQHPLMRKILRQIKIPLAVPSANVYGKVSPVRADHVLAGFKQKVPVLDGGPCKKGIESTIVCPDSQKKKLFILRPGIITKRQLGFFLKKNQIDFELEDKKDPYQPGGQKSHYKPPSPLYIIETQKTEREIRAFLLKKFPNKTLKKLKLESDPKKSARFLYSRLRPASKTRKSVLFVQKTKKQSGGLWPAIWDRLNKASSKKYRL